MESLYHSFFFGVDFSPVHKTRKFSVVRGQTSDRKLISDEETQIHATEKSQVQVEDGMFLT